MYTEVSVARWEGVDEKKHSMAGDTGTYYLGIGVTWKIKVQYVKVVFILGARPDLQTYNRGILVGLI